jgi:hypothetical protein
MDGQLVNRLGEPMMITAWDCGGKRRDDFAGRLVDVVLTVTARHDVRGPSVEREIELWHSLGGAVQDGDCTPGREEVLAARLTEAAYRVALSHGTERPFTDLELDLWCSLRRSVGRTGVAPC